MTSNSYYGSIWLHFLIKQFVGLALFWGIVWILHLTFYGPELLPLNYAQIAPLVPAAALCEILLREKRMRSLSGLSRTQLWNLSQREILFALMTIFGVIVMSKEGVFSRSFLAIFLGSYSFWITWMNLVGHRLLHRLSRRSEGRRRHRAFGDAEGHRSAR